MSQTCPISGLRCACHCKCVVPVDAVRHPDMHATKQRVPVDDFLVALPDVNPLTSVLAERGKRYGRFVDQAKYGDDIMKVLMRSPNWDGMQPDQREALRLIANKLGRICNGDPDYDDSWIDIAGYATLIVKRLQGNPT